MILYLDTSTSLFVTGIVDKNKLIAFIKEPLGSLMSEIAMDKLTTMFKNNDINPKEIKKIIVVNGPGSFTGIRIGVTIAKTYAWSINVPIIQISGLKAMAVSTDDDSYLVPIIDARRDFVYAAIYTPDKKEVLSPKHIEIKVLKEQLSELNEFHIVTNDEINIQANKVKYDPDILKIVEFFKDDTASNPHMVNPDYLKLTEAEENKDSK